MTILYLSGMRELDKLPAVMYFCFVPRLIDVNRSTRELYKASSRVSFSHHMVRGLFQRSRREVLPRETKGLRITVKLFNGRVCCPPRYL